jgi:hypothetical protein
MQKLEDLINTSEKLKEILEGSHVTGDAVGFDYWYDHRHPIVHAINRSGTLLDIGCANGFLLRCLVEWSEHTLVPYGVEPDEALLARCKVLFSGLENHFATLPLHRLNEAKNVGLPEQFDFVYWCVWDNFHFTDKRFDGWLDRAYGAVKKGGRLILGFYDGDLDVISEKVDWLDENFRRVENKLDSDTKEEAFVWWDK